MTEKKNRRLSEEAQPAQNISPLPSSRHMRKGSECSINQTQDVTQHRRSDSESFTSAVTVL